MDKKLYINHLTGTVKTLAEWEKYCKAHGFDSKGTVVAIASLTKA